MNKNTRSHEPRSFVVKVRRYINGKPEDGAFYEEHIPYLEMLSITTSMGDSSNKGAILTTKNACYQTRDTFIKVFQSMQEQLGEDHLLKDDRDYKENGETNDQKGVIRGIILKNADYGMILFGVKSQRKCLLSIEPIRELNSKTKTVIFEGGHTVELTDEEEWKLLIRCHEKMSKKFAAWAKRNNESGIPSFSTLVNYNQLEAHYRKLTEDLRMIQVSLLSLEKAVRSSHPIWLFLYRLCVLILLIIILCKL